MLFACGLGRSTTPSPLARARASQTAAVAAPCASSHVVRGRRRRLEGRNGRVGSPDSVEGRGPGLGPAPAGKFRRVRQAVIPDEKRKKKNKKSARWKKKSFYKNKVQ